MSDESKDSPNPSQLEARYANSFRIGHNAFEFVFEFGQVSPEGGHAQFHTRIVTGPGYAKALSEALSESIAQYEQAFGTLQERKSKQEP